MKSGKTSFNAEAFKGWKKEDFVAEYAGKVGEDINELWAKIQKVNGDASPGKPGDFRKKS